MDQHELNQMFDALRPDPRRERELLKNLLQDDARRKKPMKNWKRVIVGLAATALLATAATAAVWSGLNQRFLDYLDVDPEDSEAVAEAEDLLLPGAMAVDITKEDNGAALRVTQVLRDRNTIMILADFTAPEGTSLYLGEPNTTGKWSFKGFDIESADGAVAFLNTAGDWIGDGLVSGYGWSVLEDDDPLDNHISMILTVRPETGDPEFEKAVAFQASAENLSYYDWETKEIVLVYAGNWDFKVDLPQWDIGWTMWVDQVIGELDGAVITAGELYLSPLNFELALTRKGGLDFGAASDEAGDAAYSRWLSIGNNQQITLTTKDGEIIPLELCGGGIGFEEKVVAHRLFEITDPAKFQGGTLTIEWDFYDCNESGSVTILLDDLAPVEPQQ